MSFDRILGSQRETTEDDEEEDEVGKVRMVNEVVTSDTEAGQTEKRKRRLHNEKEVMTEMTCIYEFYLINNIVQVLSCRHLNITHQFFLPRIKKELPSGIGTIFSLGWKLSTFIGTAPWENKINL